MKIALDGDITNERWERAAIAASNLTELYLTIGDVRQALGYAEKSVQLADKSGDEFWKMGTRSALSDALHQTGRVTESQAAFERAEELQKNRQPKFPLLYALQGYRYCDLLLSQGRAAEVERRAEQTLEWTKQQKYGGNLLAIALDNLSLGRAHLLHSRRDLNHPFAEALTYLNRAADGLRQAGQQDYLPLGLLARAEYYRLTSDLVKAQKDLDEAFTITTRGGMGLHLADCHLEYARLYLAQGEKTKARENWVIAKEKIEKMGYHRRDKEALELEKELQ